MLLQNVYTLEGKLIKIKKIRDNMFLIKVMTTGLTKDKMNFPQVIVKGELAHNFEELYKAGDYVSIKAHIGERSTNVNGKIKPVNAIYADSIEQIKTLAAEFGFEGNLSDEKVARFKNELNVSGIVEFVTPMSNGKKRVVGLLTPQKVVVTDFYSKRDYTNIQKGSLVCVKALCQTRNKAIKNEEDNTEYMKHIDTFNVKQIIPVESNGVLRR